MTYNKRMNRIFMLLSATALSFLASCSSVPYTGRNQLVLISPDQEKGLGLQAYQETLKKSKLSDDQEKVALVRRVGQRLAKAADKPEFEWEFNLIEDDKMINAWCLPGGKVAIYTGILPVTQDEEGMAVVMGHEIAHALAKHGAERMSQGIMAQAGGLAMSVLISDKPALTQNLFSQAYGVGVGVGILLPFGRKQESESDRIGLILMAKAGYNPEAAVGFWERMHKASGKGESGELEKYLSTHPTDQTRIKQIKKWLPEAKKYRQPPQ